MEKRYSSVRITGFRVKSDIRPLDLIIAINTNKIGSIKIPTAWQILEPKGSSPLLIFTWLDDLGVIKII